ncbi:MAG: hypothetical protein ABSA83_07885 [Verrucomicrobiota bacterium]
MKDRLSLHDKGGCGGKGLHQFAATGSAAIRLKKIRCAATITPSWSNGTSLALTSFGSKTRAWPTPIRSRPPVILASEIADELETAFDFFSKIAKKPPQSST